MSPLPQVQPPAIQSAMQAFDTHFRHLPEWQNWEQKRTQLYAIEFEGHYYPPKKIVSIATGKPVLTFYGGRPTNTYLQNLNFNIIRLR